MKRLAPALVASLVFHSLIVVAFVLFPVPFGDQAPLSGGGGGNGVVIEIVGENSMSDAPLLRPRNLSVHSTTSPGTGPLGSGEGPDASGPGSGPGGADPILAQIRARIERAKHYPMLARQSGIEGVALIGFQIDTSGRPESVHLRSSSGHQVLDDEALATIQRAAPFPPYPKPLEIGIRFALKP